jgi:hypothetical protein
MKTASWTTVFLAVATAVLLAGCGSTGPDAGPVPVTANPELGTTIGSIATLTEPELLDVVGYGLVGGLAGSGSHDCPAEIRAYLSRYIRAQMPGRAAFVDELIDSLDTAVVTLEARMPPAPSRGDRFDVRVALPDGSDAISLDGGWLYRGELYWPGTLGAGAPAPATVEGPVFINKIGVVEPDLRSAFVLAGGRAAYEYVAVLRLRRSSFVVANRVRNRLNERYGSGTARARTAREIEVRVPGRYRQRKDRFLAMVDATYLERTDELIAARVEAFVRELAEGRDKAVAEIALEAVGRQSLQRLGPLLEAGDEEVRFRAARCALNLGDDRGLVTLRDLATDEASAYRLEALAAAALAARRNDASALARRLLGDADARVVLAAYEQLRRLGDLAVRQEQVGRGFYLERVAQAERPAVFVSRSGAPRVVLFGPTLRCRDNVFVETPDGNVVVNSLAGQDHVTVARRHPKRPRMIGPEKTTFEVGDIVRALGAEPGATEGDPAGGLAVPYGDVAVVMEQLIGKGAVAAEFWPGPLPKTGLIIKK